MRQFSEFSALTLTCGSIRRFQQTPAQWARQRGEQGREGEFQFKTQNIWTVDWGVYGGISPGSDAVMLLQLRLAKPKPDSQ